MASWEKYVDQVVAAAVRGGDITFVEIVRSLPNVYPNDVRDSLVRLGLTELALQFCDVANPFEPCLPLPIPHPLDYDWRYSAETRAALSSRINSLSATGTIVMIGTPTLFLSHVGPQITFLLDANPLLAANFDEHLKGRFFCIDLLTSDLPTIGADVVVADPPWYPEHTHAFAAAGAHLLDVGGALLLSLPGVGTRPSIDSERETLMTLAQQFGFKLVSLEERVLRYLVPPFERNALRAAGVPLRQNWRNGDLAIFLKIGPPPSASLHRQRQPEWVETTLRGMRVRVRTSPDAPLSGFDDPRLVSLVPGDVLPTVSRRDDRRARAKVWTSGNRIFDCHGPSQLAIVLKALSTASDPKAAVERALHRAMTSLEEEAVTAATEQLLQLASIELAEMDP